MSDIVFVAEIGAEVKAKVEAEVEVEGRGSNLRVEVVSIELWERD